MLMKLTIAVNFTNISFVTFLYESFLQSFSVHSVCVCNFLGENRLIIFFCKMLVKLNTGGAIISIVHLPASPFLWGHFIYKHISKKKFQTLEKKFGQIGLQMGLLCEHLGKIETCLENMKNKLNQGMSIKSNLECEKDTETKKMMAERSNKAANELVKVCKTYFKLTNSLQKMPRNCKNVPAGIE